METRDKKKQRLTSKSEPLTAEDLEAIRDIHYLRACLMVALQNIEKLDFDNFTNKNLIHELKGRIHTLELKHQNQSK